MPVAKRKASSKSSGKAKGAKRTKPNGSSSGQKKSKQKQNGAAGGEKRERGPPTFVVGPSSALEEADEDEAMMEEEDDILQDGANTFLNGLDLKQISRYVDYCLMFAILMHVALSDQGNLLKQNGKRKSLAYRTHPPRRP